MKLLLSFLGIALVVTIGLYVFRAPTEPPSNQIDFPITADEVERSPMQGLTTKSGAVIPIQIPDEEFEMLIDDSFMTNFGDQGFDILYYEPEGTVSVLLLEEPLSESRTAAEDYIMSTFNLSQEQLCDMNARVITNRYVSSFYADVELGFSSCPGSVQL